MVNTQSLAGQWNEVRGKLKEKWGKLSDDDLRTFNGNVDQLVGRIQQKTGESREAIERFLADLEEEGSNLLETARERVQDTAGQVAEGVRQGYAEAERVVQERPGQALAIAFGVGMLIGAGVTMLLREHGRERTYSRSRNSTEQFGRHMLDALAGILPDALTKGRG
jgi:uncharacterized protein YjbJ (UPF0337 family)